MVKIRDKQKEIMRAAEELFSHRCFHEVTLDEVAQKAKVGKGTIYRFFSSKDDLFFQTAASGFDGMCDAIEKKLLKNKDFAEQLLNACSEITIFFSTRRELFRMMQTEEARLIWSKESMWDLWMLRREKLVKTISSILEIGVKEKKIRSDVPSTVLADFLLGMLRTRARYVSHSEETFRRLEVLLDIFILGASGHNRDAINES
jgi:AcrR family transcriptional regulator